MILMNGLSGQDQCTIPPFTFWSAALNACDCPPGSIYDGYGCTSESGSAVTTAPAGAPAGAPWWQSLVQGLTAGATQSTAPKPIVVPPPQPWYSTPTGMIGLGIGALALILLLRK